MNNIWIFRKQFYIKLSFFILLKSKDIYQCSLYFPIDIILSKDTYNVCNNSYIKILLETEREKGRGRGRGRELFCVGDLLKAMTLCLHFESISREVSATRENKACCKLHPVFL